MKSLPKPLRVLLIYLAFLLPVLAWFCWETRWGITPDSSPHRMAVYVAYFLILPLAIAAMFIHLVACFCVIRVVRISLLVGGACGLAGVAALHFSIQASADREAGMGYLGIFIFFAVFSLVGFLLSSMSLSLRGRLSPE